jgi:hypothetical protein
MKQKLLMMLAALMLMGTSAMAQSETLKGDVNGDGAVDVADIAAVIQIMKDNGDIETKYYWYVGQENPASMTSISPVVTDNTSPGWRLIGTSIPSSETKLFDESNTINFGGQVIHYIAIPKQTLKLTSGGIDVTAEYAYESTVTINNVKYYIYKSKDTLRRYAYTTLM